MDNLSFLNVYNKSNMTGYRLAKEAGVSYSVVNDLLHGKKDINNCTAETVVRLASVLHADVFNLMNPISIMDGFCGKYRGIKYKWEKTDTMTLCLTDGEDEVVIPTEYRFQDPEKLTYYKGYTEFYIDEYLAEKEFLENAAKISRRVK